MINESFLPSKKETTDKRLSQSINLVSKVSPLKRQLAISFSVRSTICDPENISKAVIYWMVFIVFKKYFLGSIKV